MLLVRGRRELLGAWLLAAVASRAAASCFPPARRRAAAPWLLPAAGEAERWLGRR